MQGTQNQANTSDVHLHFFCSRLMANRSQNSKVEMKSASFQFVQILLSQGLLFVSSLWQWEWWTRSSHSWLQQLSKAWDSTPEEAISRFTLKSRLWTETMRLLLLLCVNEGDSLCTSDPFKLVAKCLQLRTEGSLSSLQLACVFFPIILDKELNFSLLFTSHHLCLSEGISLQPQRKVQQIVLFSCKNVWKAKLYSLQSFPLFPLLNSVVLGLDCTSGFPAASVSSRATSVCLPNFPFFLVWLSCFCGCSFTRASVWCFFYLHWWNFLLVCLICFWWWSVFLLSSWPV